ncbi:MAG: DUF3182 family protein [Gammaproteobacteria bacterium]|nr:MAG: DUF3182 family protein [Gammaproteobacteria bacterium]
MKTANATYSHVVLVSRRLPEQRRTHDCSAREAVAAQIAQFLECDFAGEFDPARHYSGALYFVPDVALLADDAHALGIRSNADLFGGVVPYPFVATKAITHGLVNSEARGPPGWSSTFCESVRDEVVAGFTAFALPDALIAVQRILESGSARIKHVAGIGGSDQTSVRDSAEAREALLAIGEEEIAQYGVVVEQNLSEPITYSIGRIMLGSLSISYFGTQRTTQNRLGEEVYGGSDLSVVRGGFAELGTSEMPQAARAAFVHALSYDAAVERAFPQFFASRRNYDVICGRDEQGVERSGVLEQSWRFGGASAAEVAALLALKTDATLQRIRASTYEVHADVVPPRGATVHFRGIDEHVGAITKYTMVESDGRRT